MLITWCVKLQYLIYYTQTPKFITTKNTMLRLGLKLMASAWEWRAITSRWPMLGVGPLLLRVIHYVGRSQTNEALQIGERADPYKRSKAWDVAIGSTDISRVKWRQSKVTWACPNRQVGHLDLSRPDSRLAQPKWNIAKCIVTKMVT